MTKGERIKRLREEHHMTQTDLAKKLGIATQTVFKYEKNIVTNIPLLTVEKIAEIFDVTPAYITGWDEPSPSTPNVDVFQYDNILPITTQKLPMLGDIACGQPIFTNEDRESYVVVGVDIKADFVLRAKGDSMINARIHDGDIVFIKKQPSVENGEIAAVVINDEATLKRVYYSPEQNQLTLTAENPSHTPFVYRNEELDHIHILGKAVAFQSDVK